MRILMTRYLLIPVIPKKMFLFSTHYDPPFSKVTHFKLIIIFIKLNYVDECPCVIEIALYDEKFSCSICRGTEASRKVHAYSPGKPDS